MSMLFACRLVDGRTASFDLIPAKLKAQVAEIVIGDFGLPELVPVEFGGTMEAGAYSPRLLMENMLMAEWGVG